MKKVLMGNEAVAYSLFFNGVNIAVGYPGTPSTEVIETLRNFYDDDFYVEWSINEKAALEIAAGASISGARSVVTMKQVGLNVASDPLLSLSMIGVDGGMIVFVADDPGPHSSQTEQDTRNFARFCNLPVFDPSSPAEAFFLIKHAFEASEKYNIPVIFRMTTRVCHSNEDIEFEFKREKKHYIGFQKRPDWVILPATSFLKHKELEKKLDIMKTDLGRFNMVYGSGRIGIITSGVSFFYVKEAIKDFEDMFSVLKITIAHPLDPKTILKFVENKEMLIFVEELDPVVEEETKLVLFENGISIKTFGKRNGYLDYAGEFSTDIVKNVIKKITSISLDHKAQDSFNKVDVPKRLPQLCAGCPHRSAFLMVKQACKGKDVIYTGDIGCYTLGYAKPISATDTCLCMGASITMAQGLKLANKEKTIVAFIGDSTFFHSGITGLLNAKYNNHNITVCVLDNLTTGMTGFQPHPGTGQKIYGEDGKRIEMLNLIRSAGIDDVIIIDPYDDFESQVDKIKKVISKEELSVIIFRRSCANLEKNNHFYKTNKNCISCKACMIATGCSAIYFDDGVAIDENICNGCGLCKNFCRYDAIEKVMRE